MSAIDHTLLPSLESTISQATADLRWSKDGMLQQRFALRKTDRNGYATFEYEWRNVPVDVQP